MQGDRNVIDLLNDVLTAELTSVNQYFADAKMCANWGYERLAEKFREESISEMKDSDSLIERILYLDGMPNLQRLGSVRIGETVPEKLTLALDLERSAIERLNADGTTDTSFGSGGFVYLGWNPQSIALQGDGKIVVDGAEKVSDSNPDGDYHSIRLTGDSPAAIVGADGT